MADEAEDVLELDTDDVIEDEDTDAAEPDVDADTDEDGEDEETVIRFDGEEEDEAAPASEGESSVIREMRRKLREAERELKTYREGKPEPKVELGPKPTLESCEYDEERFETELDNWKTQQTKVAAARQAEEEAEERQRAEWTEQVEAYKAAIPALGVAGYEDAEAEVFSVLHPQVQALILRQKATAPALVYALSRAPSKLEELSKLNLADAAVMVGELKAKVKVEKRPKLPDPDKPISGRASNGGANLEKLLKQARATGDYTKYHAAKRGG